MESSWCVVALGAGWVGALTMAFSASRLPSLPHRLYDPNVPLVLSWLHGRPPFYEPGLEQCLLQSLHRNLSFSSQLECVLGEDLLQFERVVLFLCLATPPLSDGQGLSTATLSRCVQDIALFYSRHSLLPHQTVTLVVKSTVPVSSCQALSHLLHLHCPALSSQMAVVSNPEFLSEGRALQDLAHPARIVIGSDDPKHGQILREYYECLYRGQEINIVETSRFSSELAKIAANSMLAQRVSSINSLSQVCEKVGADIQEVKRVLVGDSRIGKEYLEPGAGFGGSCLEKDLRCLVFLAESEELPEVAAYWRAVLLMNGLQQHHVVQKVLSRAAPPDKVLVVGLAFKAATSDVRNSQNIKIVHSLVQEGLCCVLYDELASQEQVVAELEGLGPVDQRRLSFSHSDLLSAAEGCRCLLILQPFPPLLSLDESALASQMLHPASLVDTKNSIGEQQRDRLLQAGFQVSALGR